MGLTSFDHMALSSLSISDAHCIRPQCNFLPPLYHLSHPRGQQTADTLSRRGPSRRMDTLPRTRNTAGETPDTRNGEG